ncbi:synaptic vesicle glycoprotein 2C-like [Topomyia yanbarensis]|uniref:synaptic vesicle glycoprotein 2C-like n=1 Tax=Topomyia yanbarensis TaxID=2498891 RepID=UPI00273AE12E|nr:synaptic vesicle glycoprotein 2C-like [Topomyia yanbarensis]
MEKNQRQESISLNLSEENKRHSYDEALREAGFGKAQIAMMFLCGFALMSSANESMGMGLILPASQCDLDLDMTRKGIVGGAVFIGVLISTYYWGYQTDIRGRQTVLKITLLGATCCSFLASFVNHFYLLVVLRFLVGLFISAPGSAAIVYLGEFCPTNRRGQMITYACAIAGFGFAYVAVVASWILSYDWSFTIIESFAIRPWRLLFLINSLPGFITGLVFWCYPESPRFLLAQGRHKEALSVLRWLHRQNRTDSFTVRELQMEAYQRTPNNEPDQESDWFSQARTQISPLMKQPNSINISVCCFQTATVYVAYGGLGLWFPQIMNLVFSTESTNERPICEVMQSNSTSFKSIESSKTIECVDRLQPETFIYTFALGAMCGGYTLLNSVFLTRYSEKTLIYVNLIAAGCAGIALQYVTNNYIVAILFCVEINVAAVCIILVRSMQVSLFPTQVKATVVSLTALVGRIISNIVTGVLILQQCTYTLYFIAGLLFASAGLNALLQQ